MSESEGNATCLAASNTDMGEISNNKILLKIINARIIMLTTP